MYLILEIPGDVMHGGHKFPDHSWHTNPALCFTVPKTAASTKKTFPGHPRLKTNLCRIPDLTVLHMELIWLSWRAGSWQFKRKAKLGSSERQDSSTTGP